MNIRQTYEFLLQIRRIEPRIQQTIVQYESLKSTLLPSGIRYDLDKIQTTPEDRTSIIFSKLEELATLISELQVKREQAAVDITDAILKLENHEEQAVLMGYYIGKKRVEDIADEISCSDRTAYYLKRKGVAHLSNII